MFENESWKNWIFNAIHNIPAGVSLNDALNVEELLKQWYKDITGQMYN